MNTTPVTVIGAGQAGLAMSSALTALSIEHLVLDRGEVANSWATERWDSLRLLTPNWMTRLPAGAYQGPDPDGYMTATEVQRFLASYGKETAAPVQAQTAVEQVTSTERGFIVSTSQGPIHSDAVVVATGACSQPAIPKLADELPGRIHQVAPIHYRRPGDLSEGAVLVVGASASGIQLAEELARSGRRVILAVGEHTRLPRSYRGMDIHWWMDQLGILDDRFDSVDDIDRARRLPSLQLVGTPDHRTLGLNEIQALGVQLVGRLVGISSGRAQFSGSLANQCASADLKQDRLLADIDRFATARGLDRELTDPCRPDRTHAPAPVNTVPLSEIDTVVWATGFRPKYPWLEDHLLDERGRIRHAGGVMSQPGMYVLGLPFMRRRKSSFLDGVGPDATELSRHLRSHLDTNPRTTNQPRTTVRAA